MMKLIQSFLRSGQRSGNQRSLTRALVGSVYNATWWGGYFLPPRISETTGRSCKNQAAYESPVKFVEGTPTSLISGSPMTSQVRSKIKCFAGHGSSRECAIITSSKTHVIENQRQDVSCLVHMLLLEVADNTRSGQVTKGQHMNPISLGVCDACFMANFSFHFKLNGVGYKSIRNGLGHFLVKARSMSGQKRSNFKVDIFA